ncbi:hypothetical protein BNJ_00402 [Kaumoebavirus]|uniref:hypothetical protein n=1 Tax=Kaumoebavirus TaxID=1859492 RepID=UPI0009C2F6A5|nr:hypothetical protein BNJ_00402 [Kaumoebavirus]ARA72220.1 hypothetical protein BNJ_00402 [Kaumoebavirus]
MKIICADGELEVAEETLKAVPFFKPMLEGGWEKDSVTVEEDVETFSKILACIQDKFMYSLYENDYHVYKAYNFYMCTTPDKYFLVSDSGTVHGIDKYIYRNFSQCMPVEEYTRVPYSEKVIQEGINWIYSYVQKLNFARPLSVDSVNFICDYMLPSIEKAAVSFIIHDNEVICDRTFHDFRGRKNIKIICRNPGVFALIKDYASDPRSIESENVLWESVKNFLSLHYQCFGNLMYRNYKNDRYLGGVCYNACPPGDNFRF